MIDKKLTIEKLFLSAKEFTDKLWPWDLDKEHITLFAVVKNLSVDRKNNNHSLLSLVSLLYLFVVVINYITSHIFSAY